MLTAKQLRLFTIIRLHLEQTGRSPTYREMADLMGVSYSRAYTLAQAIIARGFLSKFKTPGCANNLRLVHRKYGVPTDDGRPWVTFGDSA